MAICRKKKFASPKKVGGPEIGATHKSQKVGGPRPTRPNRLCRQWEELGRKGGKENERRARVEWEETDERRVGQKRKRMKRNGETGGGKMGTKEEGRRKRR